MAHYRIYLLDPAGHIVNGSDALCDSDDEALDIARATAAAGAAVDVWQGTRHLGIVTPGEPNAERMAARVSADS